MDQPAHIQMPGWGPFPVSAYDVPDRDTLGSVSFDMPQETPIQGRVTRRVDGLNSSAINTDEDDRPKFEYRAKHDGV